jgi:hypothetical protein
MANITFPTEISLSIEKDASFVRIEIINKSGDIISEEDGTINMFIPNGFQMEDSANFGTMNFGTIDAVKKFAGQYGSDPETAKAQATASSGESLAIGAAVINKLFAGAGDGATMAAANAGVVLNSKATATFEDMGIRTFSFNFKMVPSNKEDSDVMKKIEKTFRKYMYPEIIGNVAVSYPPRFKVAFHRGKKIDNYMPMMHEAYLTGLSSTYNENSNMFYHTGAPTDTTLSLTFQETRQLTRDDINKMESIRDDSQQETEDA